MAIKKYHVSKNLFDKDNTTIYKAYFNQSGDWLASNDSRSILISIQPNKTYTLSVYDNLTVFRIYRTNVESPAVGSTRFTAVIRGENMSSYTFSTRSDTTYIAFQGSFGTVDQWFATLMLNEGDEILPYEPYGNTWNSIPYLKYGTETDTLTSLPADVIADGQSATANIIGNMNQQGTPSPSSIIMPSECGNKTANLFDKDNPNIYNGYYSTTTNTILTTPNNAFIYIPLVQGRKYYVYGCKRSNPSTTIRWVTTSSAPSYNIPCTRTGIFAQTDIFTITAEANENYLALFVCGDSDYSAYSSVDSAIATNCANLVIDNGYKIPILSGGATTNVYLGEVQSTRNIYKIVLTGQESWSEYGTGTGHFYYMSLSPYAMMNIYPVCSHYTTVRVASEGKQLRVYESYESTTDFTNYLQQQYAAGTPVCVWYVLATETTGILNEPIRKIGNYTDSVSVTGIPTTGTAEQFDIDTTLKPSEVDLTYHGWHEHQPEKYVGGVVNKFNKDTLTDGYYIDADTGLPVEYTYQNRCATTSPIDVTAYSSVTLTYSSEFSDVNFMYSTFNGNTFIGRTTSKLSGFTIDTSNVTKIYICFYKSGATVTANTMNNIMLNEGSTALPYEPYYKWIED